MTGWTRNLLGLGSHQPRPAGAWARVIAGTVVAAVVVVSSARGGPNTSDAPAPSSPTTQSQCPVMIGKAIDPTLFTTYRGKKVYFCCPFCKSSFAKDPQAYVQRLPQFASEGGAPHGDHDDHGDDRAAGHEHPAGGASLVALVRPMGIATLSLVALTVLLGLLRRVRRLRPRLLLRIHKTTGVITLISALIHAALVLFAH